MAIVMYFIKVEVKILVVEVVREGEVEGWLKQ